MPCRVSASRMKRVWCARYGWSLIVGLKRLTIRRDKEHAKHHSRRKVELTRYSRLDWGNDKKLETCHRKYASRLGTIRSLRQLCVKLGGPGYHG